MVEINTPLKTLELLIVTEIKHGLQNEDLKEIDGVVNLKLTDQRIFKKIEHFSLFKNEVDEIIDNVKKHFNEDWDMTIEFKKGILKKYLDVHLKRK